MKIVHNIKTMNLDTKKRIYTCTKCGKLFNWSNESFWYGSYNDLENNPEKIIYGCSEKCRIELGDEPKP